MAVVAPPHFAESQLKPRPYHFANALMILKAAGETQVQSAQSTIDALRYWLGQRFSEAASELFEEARQVTWHGQRPITWESLQQTPAVHISARS